LGNGERDREGGKEGWLRRETSWEEGKAGEGRRDRGWRGRKRAGKKEVGFGQKKKVPLY
jgi:hypothetical protein